MKSLRERSTGRKGDKAESQRPKKPARRQISRPASREPAYERTGVLQPEDLRRSNLLPSKERFDKGPVVVVECVQEIPCNPCADACVRKAIRIEGNITNVPKVDFDACNGCTVCIARCPGLAIFVVDKNYNRREAAISLPYELLPRPQKGDIVAAVDRSGTVVGKARVEKVLDSKALDRCAVVTVAVPKRLYNTVRGIRVTGTRMSNAKCQMSNQ